MGRFEVEQARICARYAACVWPERYPKPLLSIFGDASSGVVEAPELVVLLCASAVYPRPSKAIRVPKPINVNGVPHVVIAAFEGRSCWFSKVIAMPALPDPPGHSILMAGRPWRAPVYAYLRPEELEIRTR